MTPKVAAVMLAAVLGGAVRSAAQDVPTHGWIDVDVAQFHSSQDEATSTWTRPLYLETSAAIAMYPKLPNATGLGLAGGAGIYRGLGVGVAVGAVDYRSTVGIGIAVPSPYFFNLTATDGAVTSPALERHQRSVDVSAQYVVPVNRHLTVRVFGGPTYFHVSNDMVETIRYSQVASALLRINVVGITSFTHAERTGSAWGYNAGGDVAVFFTRTIGVGGGVRVNQGTVSVDDPLNGTPTDLKVGHVVVSGGLRLRF